MAKAQATTAAVATAACAFVTSNSALAFSHPPQIFTARRVPAYSASTSTSTTGIGEYPNQRPLANYNDDSLLQGRIVMSALWSATFDVTIDDFNADLEAISSRSAPTSPSVKASNEAESMLRDALSQYQASPTTTAAIAIRPNRRSFELVMQAYLNLGRSRFDDPQQCDTSNENVPSICSADKVATLHQIMEQLWEDEGRPEDLGPTIDTFNAVLAACAACAGPQSTSSSNIRRWRKRRQSGSDIGQEADQQQQKVNYAGEAESVLKRMQDLTTELYDQDDSATTNQSSVSEAPMVDVRPDAVSYSLLAAAWARQQPMGPGGTSWSGYERHSFKFPGKGGYNDRSSSNDSEPTSNVDGECAAKAEERLRILEAMFVEPETEPGVLDDVELPYLLAEAYDDVIAAWARSGVEGAPFKAEDVLRRWEAFADDLDEWSINARIWEKEQGDSNSCAISNDYEEDLSPLSIIPTSEAYTSVILAHALSQSNLGPQKASDWLERTLYLYESGKWGNNRPDLVAFNAVITAWSRCNDDGAAEKGEEWLNRLISLRSDFDDGRFRYLSPDSVSFNAALNGWCRLIERGESHTTRRGMQVKNDSTNQAEALRRAQHLFDRMEVLCTSGENPNACPTARTYGSLIFAWTRSGQGGDAADAANNLLQKMEGSYSKGDNDCRPSLQLYSATIKAYARTGRVEDAQKAIDLLHHLNGLSSRGGKWDELRPDIVIYSSVLDAIAKSRMHGGAAFALRILTEVEDSYAETGDELCAPNQRFYTAVVFVLANCRQEGNVQKANKILMKLERQYEETGDESFLLNSFTYNYAINCAANTLGPLEVKGSAFKIALQAFQSLRKSTVDKPNSFTFAFFLKACNSLLPHGDMRYNVIRRTMNECCEAGMLSDEVVNWLRRGVPADMGREILRYPENYQTVRTRDLPSDWSCNVRRNKKY